MEYISTTTLAEELNVEAANLFSELKNLGFIHRKNDKWVLTDLGIQKGGKTRNHSKFGEYIVWPENIKLNSGHRNPSALINATAIGKHFNISSQKLNLLLSELGWIEKDIAGWVVTKLGKLVGGKQFEHETSGNFYVLWPESLLSNKSLVELFNPALSIKIDFCAEPQIPETEKLNNFREKFPAPLRTRDGHFVRSRAEVIIDDFLYTSGLVHAYERKVPIEEELYTDFYLFSSNVYIEYWGLENDPVYVKRKQVKVSLYKKYDLKLIQLTDGDLTNIDDRFPEKLLRFGITLFH